MATNINKTMLHVSVLPGVDGSFATSACHPDGVRRAKSLSRCRVKDCSEDRWVKSAYTI